MTRAPRYVVCGASRSGKTTWVEERRKPGDVVWDWDRVAEVIFQQPGYPMPLAYRIILHTMRDALVKWCSGNPTLTTYVIVSDQKNAQLVARQLSAELIDMGRAHEIAAHP